MFYPLLDYCLNLNREKCSQLVTGNWVFVYLSYNALFKTYYLELNLERVNRQKMEIVFHSLDIQLNSLPLKHRYLESVMK